MVADHIARTVHARMRMEEDCGCRARVLDGDVPSSEVEEVHGTFQVAHKAGEGKQMMGEAFRVESCNDPEGRGEVRTEGSVPMNRDRQDRVGLKVHEVHEADLRSLERVEHRLCRL